jgi:hypothetical protein
MKTELVEVTPHLARQWLAMNDMNRPIRRSHVETLRASFERGEYVQTHQGVAFGIDGHLIDGQHRLTAISLLPDDMRFPMLVTWGLSRKSAFPVVDATQAKRSTSDVLAVDRGLGECANFLAKLYQGRSTGITPVFVSPFVDYIRDDLLNLLAFCGTARKTWSSAPVRAAAVFSIKRGNGDYAKSVYRAMVLADFEAMPPIAKGLFRAHLAGSVSATASYDIFARSIKLFDPALAKLTKVQINDVSEYIAAARDQLGAEVFRAGKKKAPAVTRGAKSGVYGLDSATEI